MNPVRFVYLTDTHVGCDDTGYFLQPRHLGREEVLFQGLGRWLQENDVSFVIHGGDLTDHGAAAEIDRADALCAMLDVPVYLCLGNHDLAQADSMQLWREAPCGLLPGGQDCFAADAGAARVLVVSHHWHPTADYHWISNEAQTPRLDARQIATLQGLMRDAGKPVIAVTHAPLNAVPAEQCGGDEPFHAPHAPYLTSWQRLAAEHANLRLVLCGHNHAHSQHDHGSFVSCTTAAFGEGPTQIRLITVTQDQIEIKTIGLAEVLGLPVLSDADQAWCVGAATDHHFSIPLNPN